jgi:lysosomal Pro-X carboxypeptidase
MAMTDYPYPSSFLEPMPAFPVNVSCKAFAKFDSATTSQSDTWGMLKAASDVYFNSSGQITCSNINDTDATGALDGAGWNILACNQLAMPTSMGADSMFIAEPFDYAGYTKKCQETYGLTPNYQWALENFGGYNYTNDFKSYSNIIFSNGELDPWKAGGVTTWVNIDLPQYVIKNAAHHLYLRLPVEADKGTDVEWVRQQESILIGKWVEAYQGPVPVKANMKCAKQITQFESESEPQVDLQFLQ